MPNNDSNKENFQYGLLEGFSPSQTHQEPVSHSEVVMPKSKPVRYIGRDIPYYENYENRTPALCEGGGILVYDRVIQKNADSRGIVVINSDIRCTGIKPNGGFCECRRRLKSNRKIRINTHKFSIREYKPWPDDNR